MSEEYGDVARSITEAVQNEFLKHEDEAVAAALKVAHQHGFKGAAAKEFVKEIIKNQRIAMCQKVSWVW